MQCDQCGARRTGAFRYCRECGRDFEPPDVRDGARPGTAVIGSAASGTRPVAGAGPMAGLPPAAGGSTSSRCPTCGARRIGAFRYCTGCGHDYEAPQRGSPTVPAPLQWPQLPTPSWPQPLPSRAWSLPVPEPVPTAARPDATADQATARASVADPATAPVTTNRPTWRAWSTTPAGLALRGSFVFLGIVLLAYNFLPDLSIGGRPGASTGRVPVATAPGGAVLGEAVRSGEPSPSAAPSGTPARRPTSAPAGAGPAPTTGPGTLVPPGSPVAASPAAQPTTSAGAPAASQLPTTVELSGSGSGSSASFAYPGGEVRVRSAVSTSSPSGCVYIGTFESADPALLGDDRGLRTAVVIIEGVGADEGWVDLDIPFGDYFVAIESDCDWVVTVAPR